MYMKLLSHYYGDIVRALFLIGGIVMMLALPFFKNLIPAPYFVSIFALVVIATTAGLTAPSRRWTMRLNLFVSFLGFAVFEYFAVTQYGEVDPALFLTNQLLAFVFFFSFYYSVKTSRGHFDQTADDTITRDIPPMDGSQI